MADRDSSWVLPVGLLGLAAYFVNRWLNPAPPDPSDGQGGHVDAAEEDDRPATFTESEARAYASQLVDAFRGFTEDEAAVIRILTRAQVTADVRLLVNGFGVQDLLTGYSSEYDLAQAVGAFVEPEEVAAINDNYRAKGIDFQF